MVEAFKLETETVETLFKELLNYVEPKKNIIAEQFKFFKRQQADLSELFDKFFIELKKMAKRCEFGELEDNLLKVRIVLGVNDHKLQESLIRTPDMSLDKIIDHCRATETALLNQLMLSEEDGPKSIDEVKFKSSCKNCDKQLNMNFRSTMDRQTKTEDGAADRSKEYDCKKCGYKHKARECPAYNKQCMKCESIGHLKIGCKKGKFNSNDSSKDHNRVDEVYFIDTINGGKDGYWEKTLIINDNSVSFKLDSGADLNVLPFDMLSNIGVDNNEINYCGMKVQAFEGFVLNAKGKLKIKCKVDRMIEEVEFVVIDNKYIKSILGRDTCEK